MSFSESLRIAYESSSLRVKSRETSAREFKEKFNIKEIADYLRVMAAMANGDGGIIIFGVTDSPRAIVGVDADFIDGADLSNHIKQYFEPFIQFEIDAELIGGKNVCAIKVFPCNQKPVICKKVKTVKRKKGNKEVDETVLEEAAIYFRYGPKSSKIDFADLQRLLRERQKTELNSILQNFEIMQKIGFQNVGVIDASSNSADRRLSALYVSEETAKNLNLIKKGKLVHDKSAGSSAYFVVGEVELRKGIEIPIPDSDRLLPYEAKSKLSPSFKTAFPNIFTGNKQLNHTQLKNISCSYKIRHKKNDGQHDTRYCFYDSKTRRFFYRNAFIEFIEGKIKSEKSGISEILQTT